MADNSRDSENTQSFVNLIKGTEVSHYTIIEKIGTGGMGEVYLAEDTALKRKVAMKFLPDRHADDQEFKARFIREAEAAAALSHANIVTIHEVSEFKGRPYFVMEYVAGSSLKEIIKKDQLSIEETVKLTIGICKGLDKAHRAGITHRDIKPANILLDSDKRAKILDFGLAAIQGDATLTKTGSTMGTIGYMSPEQVKGKATDHRSDLFSLGVVLYEMITGRAPFKGETKAATLNSIINDTPEPVRRFKSDIPDNLQNIIDKALDKDPETRYQTAAGLKADLKRVKKILESDDAETRTTAITQPNARPKRPRMIYILPVIIVAALVAVILIFPDTWKLKSPPPLQEEISARIDDAMPSIAVLPFDNLSADVEQEYFCSGIAEEIINALTRLEGLRVVARTSSFAFKNKDEDIREIGRKLNVKMLLEGSVRKSGDQLRITAQLISVADGFHLWSQRYDRKMEDIFAIQDDISQAIVGALEVRIAGTGKESIVKPPTRDIEAYNLYLKGRYFWNKRTGEGVQKSLEQYHEAIKIDSNYALAYAGIADCYNMLGFYDYLPSDEAFVKAKAAAIRALAIDDNLAEAHTSLAHVKMYFDWDLEAAEEEFRRAIVLNPGYATAHQWYSEYLALMGRNDESLIEARKAIELDPISPIMISHLGVMFYIDRDYDRAIEQYQYALEIDPNCLTAHVFLPFAYAQKGIYPNALVESQRAFELAGGTAPALKATIGYVHALMGDSVQAENIRRELLDLSERMHISPWSIALIHVGLEQHDEAFKWLNIAYMQNDPRIITIKAYPAFESLRSDPRFAVLLSKIGL